MQGVENARLVKSLLNPAASNNCVRGSSPGVQGTGRVTSREAAEVGTAMNKAAGWLALQVETREREGRVSRLRAEAEDVFVRALHVTGCNHDMASASPIATVLVMGSF